MLRPPISSQHVSVLSPKMAYAGKSSLPFMAHSSPPIAAHSTPMLAALSSPLAAAHVPLGIPVAYEGMSWSPALEPALPERPQEFLISPKKNLGLLGFSLFVYFRHPSISDEKKTTVLVKTTWDRATATVQSGSTVFSFQQRSLRVVRSSARNRLKLAAKPQQKGGGMAVRRYLNSFLIN